jgi:hypothetical protein
MFWHVMLMLLSPLYLLFGLVFRGEGARLVLALLSHRRILSRRSSLYSGHSVKQGMA